MRVSSVTAAAIASRSCDVVGRQRHLDRPARPCRPPGADTSRTTATRRRSRSTARAALRRRRAGSRTSRCRRRRRRPGSRSARRARCAGPRARVRVAVDRPPAASRTASTTACTAGTATRWRRASRRRRSGAAASTLVGSGLVVRNPRKPVQEADRHRRRSYCATPGRRAACGPRAGTRAAGTCSAGA